MTKGEESKLRGLSLRAKNTLIFSGLFALLIVILWLINSLYLPEYYLKKQLVSLEETRVLVEQLALNPDNEDLQLGLSRQCQSSGIAVILVKEDALGTPVILFSEGGERGPWRMWQPDPSGADSANTVFKETESYTITQMTDPLTRMERVECRGSLLTEEQSFTYQLSLPLARIEESAGISNRFLLLMGAGILLLGAALVFLVTWRMTRPIVTLNHLSQKMAGLDFSERFEGHSGDEIQTLGENINHLSETLETTIADLKRANLTLEQDVQEKALESERRKELLANISHELKTPIALVQGYAEGLRDGMCEDPDTRSRYSEVILDEADRMNRLVRQLLSLNEMESGQLTVEKNAFDLAELIRDLSQAYAIKDDGRGIRLELDTPRTLMVESDELLMEQILQNYLSNAFHYVKEGGLVRISASRTEESTLISVYNEGDQIPEESLNLVWEKFYKVDKARTRSYGGSGIGLSLVKAASEILGGSCRVENREDGVCFMVQI